MTMNTTFEWNKQLLLDAHPFSPLHHVITQLEADGFPTLDDFNQLLELRHQPLLVESGKRLRFVEQEEGRLSFEAQYEPRCYLQGEVPTRADNWHDLLNALVWLTFPQAKALINARHFQELQQVEKPSAATPGSQRGAVRDAMTLLDESGVIVPYADAELAELLRDFRWKELFWQHRARVQAGMGFYLFGHGLYEKALKPYIGMTGQGLLLQVEPVFFTWPLAKQVEHLDTLLAEYLASAENCRSTRELTPVPLLGVPGWAKDNVNASYYDNTDYFRAGRHGRTTG